MTDYCAFSRGHKCIKWSDYQLTRYELREAEELCHSNWQEIQRLRRYIPALQELLQENGIEYPPEEEFWE